jgi:hypothetical protein
MTPAFKVSVMLAHVLHDPAVAERSFQYILPQHLTHTLVGGETWQGILFDIIKRYYQQYREIPGDLILFNQLSEVTSLLFPERGDPRAMEIFEKSFEFLKNSHHLAAGSGGLASETIEFICHRVVRDAAIKQQIEQAEKTGTLHELGDHIHKIRTQYAGASGSTIISGISTMETEQVERVRTGVDFVDSSFGKGAGPVAGAGIAVLAGQGSGKTTFLTQLAISNALLGKPALLVMTEQGFQPIIRAKILSCCTGVPFDVISDGMFNMPEIARRLQWSADQIEIMQAKLALLDKNFHILDQIANPGGINEIENEIHNLERRHSGRLGIFCIDWAGPLASHMKGMDPKRFGDARDLPLRAVADWVARVASAHNNIGVVAQQLSSKANERGPFADNSYFDGEDCKSFCESMRYCLTLNARNPKALPGSKGSDVQKMRIAKSRDDNMGENILVRNENGTCFKRADGWEQRGKRFVTKDSPAKLSHALPVEERARNAVQVERV